MDRQAVQSSNVASIGYDPVLQRLEVEFHGGGVYHYFAVSPEEHAALMAAESKGAYMARHIKPLHTTMKVTLAKPDQGAGRVGSGAGT